MMCSKISTLEIFSSKISTRHHLISTHENFTFLAQKLTENACFLYNFLPFFEVYMYGCFTETVFYNSNEVFFLEKIFKNCKFFLQFLSLPFCSAFSIKILVKHFLMTTRKHFLHSIKPKICFRSGYQSFGHKIIDLHYIRIFSDHFQHCFLSAKDQPFLNHFFFFQNNFGVNFFFFFPLKSFKQKYSLNKMNFHSTNSNKINSYSKL